MKIIQKLDRNPTTIGLQQTHTTNIGAIMGIISISILLCFAVYKIIPVLNYQKVYINYWVSQQYSPVNISDLQPTLDIMAFYTFNNTNKTQAIKSIKQNNFQQNAQIRKLSKEQQNKILKYVVVVRKIIDKKQYFQEYPLVQCPSQPNIYCFPRNVQFKIFGSCGPYKTDCSQVYIQLSRDHMLQQNKFQQQQQDSTDLIIMCIFLFYEKAVNPTQYYPRYTMNMTNAVIAETEQNELNSTIQEYTFYFSSVNVTTDFRLFPIPFVDYGKSHENYWKHQKLLDSRSSAYILQKQKCYIRFYFKRTYISNIYERNYQKLDSVLAEVLAISSIIGIIIWILLGHHSNWAKQKYLLQKVTNKLMLRQINFSDKQQMNGQQQQEIYERKAGYFSYVLSCCTKSKSLKMKEKAQKQIIKQISQSGSLISLYQQTQQLKQLQLKIRVLQKVLSQENKNLFQIYKQRINEIEKNQNLTQNESRQNEVVENEETEISHQINIQITEQELKEPLME